MVIRRLTIVIRKLPGVINAEFLQPRFDLVLAVTACQRVKLRRMLRALTDLNIEIIEHLLLVRRIVEQAQRLLRPCELVERLGQLVYTALDGGGQGYSVRVPRPP